MCIRDRLPPPPTPSPSESPAPESALSTGPEEEATPSPLPEEPFTPPTITGTSVTVLIEIVQPSWVSITADGVVRYEGLARSGEILNYTGQQSVGVRANNAAGLRLTVNNQPQGVLGERGELFDYTFTLAGMEPPPPESLSSGDAVSGLSLTPDTVAALLTASPPVATLLFTATPGLPPIPTPTPVSAREIAPAAPVASPAPTPAHPPDGAIERLTLLHVTPRSAYYALTYWSDGLRVTGFLGRPTSPGTARAGSPPPRRRRFWPEGASIVEGAAAVRTRAAGFPATSVEPEAETRTLQGPCRCSRWPSRKKVSVA